MKTYQFRVVVEPDEDRWIAYCPALETKGAATGGYTRDEARKNIQEALEMVLETLIELEIPIPDNEEAACNEELITVTI